MTHIGRTGRPGALAAAGALAAVLLLVPAVPAGAVPELSVIGGVGVPGGAVTVTLSLAEDVGNEAATADVDLAFPVNQIEFPTPTRVIDSCTIAARLGGTHQLGGTLAAPGLLRLSIFDPIPPEISTLGNGELASCSFRILDGVPPGTAPLTLDEALVFDADGSQLAITAVDGQITVVESLPTETPTETATPSDTDTPEPTPTSTAASPTATPPNTPTATQTTRPSTPTATATNTVSTPPTATATATLTATSTRPPGGGGGGGGCAIAPTDASPSWPATVLLLVPVTLLWARRRRL